MYSVSSEYLTAIKKKTVTDKIAGAITFTDGTALYVNDENIIKNSLKITKELCGEKYRIGTFNLSCLNITCIDEDALERNYNRAKITLSYMLLTDEENDVWESVPLGVYVVDGTLVKRKRDKISLTAYDYGIYFDNEPSEAIRAMSGTPDEILAAICDECGVAYGGLSDDFPNTDIIISPTSAQLQSNRDIVMWISALLCGYATIDRHCKLNIIRARYEQDGTTIAIDRHIYSDERDSIYVTDTRAYIKYLSAYSDSSVKEYASSFEATDEQAAPAAYSMSKNPLLSGMSASDCDSINEAWLSYVDNFMQRGIEATIYGDPAIDTGDTIRCHDEDVDQRASIVGVITRYEWRYRNYAYICCSAPQCTGVSADSSSTGGASDIKTQTEKRIDSVSSGGGGGTYNNCIIIAEKDSDYLLHSYTQVDYIAGNRICYGTINNNVVCGGYIYEYGNRTSPDVPTSPPYGMSITLNNVATSTSSAVLDTPITIYIAIESASTNSYTIRVRCDETGMVGKYTQTTYDLSKTGFYLRWMEIKPPSSSFPYGYLRASLNWAWYSSYLESGGVYSDMYIGFASEAEYNAAIALTYEPVTLTAVNEIITNEE